MSLCWLYGRAGLRRVRRFRRARRRFRGDNTTISRLCEGLRRGHLPKDAEASRRVRLGNGELRNQQNPRTFFIQTRDEREAVKPGDLVKLLFEIVDPTDHMPSAERMWVQVIDAKGGRYVGALDNESGALKSICPGSRIEFGPEHIISLTENWPGTRRRARQRVGLGRRDQRIRSPAD